MNPLHLPTELPLARYRLTFLITHPLQLPPYAASTLRGVFGHTLLATACTCSHKTSPHHAGCPYAQIFEPAPNPNLPSSIRNNPPPPYLIETPLVAATHYPVGSEYHFHLVLMGQARHWLPLLTAVFDQAFTHGLGTGNRGKGKLIRVEVQQPNHDYHLISQNNSPISIHTNSIALPENYSTHPLIQLFTPLRIQQKGKIISAHELTQTLFLRQLLRRYLTLAQLHWSNTHSPTPAELSEQISEQHTSPTLTWHEQRRYSNRQGQTTPLSGIIGTWQLTNLSPAFAQMLYIGQWLHLGKETVFGNGQYQILQTS